MSGKKEDEDDTKQQLLVASDFRKKLKKRNESEVKDLKFEEIVTNLMIAQVGQIS